MTALPQTSKRCPGCRQTMPAAAFYPLRTGGLSSYCRTCQRASTHASYFRRRQNPAALELMRARDRDRKRQTRAAQRGGR